MGQVPGPGEEKGRGGPRKGERSGSKYTGPADKELGCFERPGAASKFFSSENNTFN